MGHNVTLRWSQVMTAASAMHGCSWLLPVHTPEPAQFCAPVYAPATLPMKTGSTAASRPGSACKSEAYLHITLMQRACDDEHHVVNHVAIRAEVQELGKRLISLQDKREGIKQRMVWLS
jgi:hypothetical protein